MYTVENGNSIKCTLCPNYCVLAKGEKGLCGVRQNKGGSLELPFYGKIIALAVDPIEKKPLYHFRPKSKILSAGFAGCNLHCPFCQNWHISQLPGGREIEREVRGRFYPPSELAAAAKPYGALAYTYSEPLVHIEYLLECMACAQKNNVANVLVTNGCINSGAAIQILPLTAALNIDLKCFSKDSYSKILGGNLDAVLNFIRMSVEKKIHVELTTLVVPGFNDSIHELDKCRDFIAELESGGAVVPWHLSAYHPSWKYNAPATDAANIIAAVKRAKEKLPYVYAGNISYT
jgi:pyruvate formate lyase activating enzyme